MMLSRIVFATKRVMVAAAALCSVATALAEQSLRADEQRNSPAAKEARQPDDAPARPNILWITSEDNSPLLGCYGDSQAATPHLDKLASEGVRYTHAFANAPVCSAARTTLILGMYPPTVGLQHHRSRYRIPDGFEKYPVLLRRAGYYCTNNSKTDYNIAGNDSKTWDESSKQAHYKNRADGQPFFAIFNITTSHESQPRGVPQLRESGKLPREPRLSADSISIPPYHPRERDIVDEWVNYYDNVSMMDDEAGRRLAELDEAGLADDTIVFYYSDHGGALPRGKRNLHDSGTHVPLIVRFPKRWSHLAPSGPGTECNRLVSFVDFAPTLLSIAGISIPENMQGRAFLGEQTKPADEFVYLFRGRMDERYDFCRAVRDHRFRYIRNFSPHLPYGQHYSYPFEVLKSMRAWHQAFVEGRCDDVQAAYWRQKPAEELYDVEADPYEVKNLAGDPEHAGRLKTMRTALFERMAATRDTGFIPEAMFGPLTSETPDGSERASASTLYDLAQSDRYPLAKIMRAADDATSRDTDRLVNCIEAMRDEHPVVRYWGAMGAVVLGPRVGETKDELRESLHNALDKLRSDEFAAVRVGAAYGLGRTGRRDVALDGLRQELEAGDSMTQLAALNALDDLSFLDPSLSPLLKQKYGEPADRIARYLLEQIDSLESRHAHTPVDGYEQHVLQGWTVYVHEQLWIDEPIVTARAFRLVDEQLAIAAKSIPEKAVEKLRTVRIFLSPKPPNRGMTGEYHPEVGWLKANGRLPVLVEAVEFTNVPIFDRDVKRMPVLLIHELAHAYHHQVLGFDHAEIERVYKRAAASGKYDAVERWDGRTEKSYAMANAKEYFAELSESYFGRNDFFPFNRRELESYDPEMFALLKKVWGVEN